MNEEYLDGYLDEHREEYPFNLLTKIQYIGMEKKWDYIQNNTGDGKRWDNKNPYTLNNMDMKYWLINVKLATYQNYAKAGVPEK